MQDEIVTKINSEINKNISNECQVVFIMVEIRKLLDRMRDEDDDNFFIIRFYCDWIVHIKKEKNNAIQDIMEKINNEIPLDCQTSINWKFNAKINDFANMGRFESEMKSLFKLKNLNNKIFIKNNWINFISLLVQNLINQPIMNPISSIKTFAFEPSKNGYYIYIVEFNDDRGKLRFGGNIYR